MSDEMLRLVAGVVAFWEDSTRAELIQAYPTDWQPEILYAEWMWAPMGVSGTRKKPVFYNGNSSSRDFVGPLQDLLRTVEQKHGVVIDHIYAKREEGHLTVLWHVPGPRVRKHGTVLIASAAITGPTYNSEKGVA